VHGGAGGWLQRTSQAWLITASTPVLNRELYRFTTTANRNRTQQQKCVGDDTKGAALRSPNYTRKTKKYVIWNQISASLPKFCEKLQASCKISLELGNRLLRYGQKTTFKTADVHHLEFWKCSYLLNWLSSSSKSAVVYQISLKLGDFFSWRYMAI